jgi:hypothetical protein
MVILWRGFLLRLLYESLVLMCSPFNFVFTQISERNSSVHVRRLVSVPNGKKNWAPAILKSFL